jgi:hypothetical protein
LITPPDRLSGFALLNLIQQAPGHQHEGRIVDCLLTAAEVDLWHAAILALTEELASQGADIVRAFASTTFVAEALQRSGFVRQFALEFSLRDRQGVIPGDLPFHLMPIEADYAYT